MWNVLQNVQLESTAPSLPMPKVTSGAACATECDKAGGQAASFVGPSGCQCFGGPTDVLCTAPPQSATPSTGYFKSGPSLLSCLAGPNVTSRTKYKGKTVDNEYLYMIEKGGSSMDAATEASLESVGGCATFCANVFGAASPGFVFDEEAGRCRACVMPAWASDADAARAKCLKPAPGDCAGRDTYLYQSAVSACGPKPELGSCVCNCHFDGSLDTADIWACDQVLQDKNNCTGGATPQCRPLVTETLTDPPGSGKKWRNDVGGCMTRDEGGGGAQDYGNAACGCACVLNGERTDICTVASEGVQESTGCVKKYPNTCPTY